MSTERPATAESIAAFAEANGYEITDDIATLLADYFAPEPVIAPGATGWAVTSLGPVRWLRVLDGWQYVGESEQGWTRDGSVLEDRVPDPEPLTAEAVDALLDRVGVVGLMGLRELLAPYVAKGGGSR